MPGYSKTPLFKKLGYKEGMRVYLVDAPEEYLTWVQPLPDVDFVNDPPYDFVHVFVNKTDRLEELTHQLRHEIVSNGMIWISWYKKASKLSTEITEDTIRDIVLPTGLVDIKVCSVTDEWSGLKVVIRKELRIL
jgi:hypothetical protein